METLVFSHANGFPLPTYRQLIHHLQTDFKVVGIEKFGHLPQYPVTPGWRYLVDELSDTFVIPSHDPVWLVGHSLGGYLSLMAALKYPKKVRGVVMIDSPIFYGYRALGLRTLQWLSLDEKYTPAKVTLNRKNQWPNLLAVYQHFVQKPQFACWDNAVLWDYCRYGTTAMIDTNQPPDSPADECPRQLLFKPTVEYQIYRTLPSHIHNQVKRERQRGWNVPVMGIIGNQSPEIAKVGLRGFRWLTGANGILSTDGGHLFPMENPLKTATLIKTAIHQMKKGL